MVTWNLRNHLGNVFWNGDGAKSGIELVQQIASSACFRQTGFNLQGARLVGKYVGHFVLGKLEAEHLWRSKGKLKCNLCGQSTCWIFFSRMFDRQMWYIPVQFALTTYSKLSVQWSWWHISKIFISRDGFHRLPQDSRNSGSSGRTISVRKLSVGCQALSVGWHVLARPRVLEDHTAFCILPNGKSAVVPESPKNLQSPQNTIGTVLLRSFLMVWYGMHHFQVYVWISWIHWKWGGVSRWYLLLWLQPHICRGRWIWQWKQFAGGCHCGTARDVSGCGFLFFFFFALLNITQQVLFRIGLKPPTPALVLLRLQVKSRSLNTQRSQIRELSMLRWCHFVSGGSFDVFEFLWVCQYVPKSAYTVYPN